MSLSIPVIVRYNVSRPDAHHRILPLKQSVRDAISLYRKHISHSSARRTFHRLKEYVQPLFFFLPVSHIPIFIPPFQARALSPLHPIFLSPGTATTYLRPPTTTTRTANASRKPKVLKTRLKPLNLYIPPFTTPNLV